MKTGLSYKWLETLRPVLIVGFSFFLVMCAGNLLFIFIYPGQYYFANASSSQASIYSSINKYIIYNVVSVIVCSIILFLVLKKIENRLLIFLLGFYLFLFLYPFLVD